MGEEILRGDFVGGISTHHVQNRKTSTRMIRHPRVKAQDIVLEDDNDVAAGNHCVNLLLGQDAVPVHFGCRHVGEEVDCCVDSMVRIAGQENCRFKIEFASPNIRSK